MKLETFAVWCSLVFTNENLCFLVLFLQALGTVLLGLINAYQEITIITYRGELFQVGNRFRPSYIFEQRGGREKNKCTFGFKHAYRYLVTFLKEPNSNGFNNKYLNICKTLFVFLDSPLKFYLAIKINLQNNVFHVLCVSGACIPQSFALVLKSPENEQFIQINPTGIKQIDEVTVKPCWFPGSLVKPAFMCGSK